jgi:hypothetical protein
VDDGENPQVEGSSRHVETEVPMPEEITEARGIAMPFWSNSERSPGRLLVRRDDDRAETRDVVVAEDYLA